MKALVLDSNYMALSVVSWRKVFGWIVRGKIETVEGSKVIFKLNGVNSIIEIPSLVRLKNPIPCRAHMVGGFSKKKVLARDNYKCQYCGISVKKSAEVEHVFPKSRGGEKSYRNCVTSCTKCNQFKKNRTPEEAGMNLLRQPKNPDYAVLNNFSIHYIREEWKDYIFGGRK